MTLTRDITVWDQTYDIYGVRRWCVRGSFNNITASPLQITFAEDFLQQVRQPGVWTRYNGYSIFYHGPAGPYVAPVRLALTKRGAALEFVNIPGYEVKYDDQTIMHHLYGMPLVATNDMTTTDSFLLIEVTGFDAGGTDDLHIAVWGESYDPSGMQARTAPPTQPVNIKEISVWPWNR